MSVRHEQARERFDRLTKQTADGAAFYPYGARGAGYRLGEGAARRIKFYFAYQFWILMGLLMVELAFFSKLLDAHPFFAALGAGRSSGPSIEWSCAACCWGVGGSRFV